MIINKITDINSHKLDFTKLFNILLDHKVDIGVSQITDHWLECDTVKDYNLYSNWNICNRNGEIKIDQQN